MQQSLEFFDALVWIMILSHCLLDVLCYKYRHLAKYYIYIHSVHLVVTRMLPNPQSDVFSIQPMQMAFIFAAYNFNYYCD